MAGKNNYGVGRWKLPIWIWSEMSELKLVIFWGVSLKMLIKIVKNPIIENWQQSHQAMDRPAKRPQGVCVRLNCSTIINLSRRDGHILNFSNEKKKIFAFFIKLIIHFCTSPI